VRIIAFLPALVIALVMAWLTGMWQFALFALLSVISGYITSVVVKQKRKDPDLDFTDQPIWIHSSAVAIGDQVLPRTGWFFKEHFSDHFFNYFSQLATTREVANKARVMAEHFYKASRKGELPFWAGIAENTDLEFDLARDGPHCLIVGATGSGKSEFLKLLTCSLLASVEINRLRLVLIDFKGGAALKSLTQHPSALTLITDIDSADHERFWNYLQGELRVRELELSKLGKSSIEETPAIPRMLVLADELPAILASSPLALASFEAIAARGRSLGVHLIATSQSLSGIPRSLLTNLPLRFALGLTDPGDLISLMPSARLTDVGSSRAVAITSGRTVGFDFPMITSLPNLGDAKLDPNGVDRWSNGLPTELYSESSNVGLVEDALNHSEFYVEWSEFAKQNLLVVGSQGTGKTSFSLRARGHFGLVLDCPDVSELEQALVSGETVCCVISSSQVLPLSLQRKFEQVIYLKQSNIDQHIAAGLPRNQWRENLPPGRCWYRGRQMQLVKPALNQDQSAQVNEPQQLVR